MEQYRINLTLQVQAVNPRAAKRLVRLVGKDIANSRRRPACPGASGVTHAWMDIYPELIGPAPDVDIDRWADDGGAVCAA